LTDSREGQHPKLKVEAKLRLKGMDEASIRSLA
jgi:hypothetical protein